MNTSRCKVIIFSGKAQSGKSTSALYALKWYASRGYCGMQEIACADKLKQLCHDLLDIPKDWLWGSGDDKNRLTNIHRDTIFLPPEEWAKLGSIDPTGYLTVRQVLQYVGTNVFRRMFPNCWINYTKKYILDKNISIALVTDARFPNEIDSFAEDDNFTTYLIRLNRNPLNNGHDSETSLDDYKPSNANIKIFNVKNSDLDLEIKDQLIGRVLSSIEAEDE